MGNRLGRLLLVPLLLSTIPGCSGCRNVSDKPAPSQVSLESRLGVLEDGQVTKSIARKLKQVENAIEIRSAEDFQKIGVGNDYPLDGDYVLTQDIDFKEKGFTSIGDSDDPFTGTFNGRNHSLSNFVIDKPEKDYVSLFDTISSDAIITNLVLKGKINGRNHVAGLAVENQGNILYCSFIGELNGVFGVGGLVSYNQGTLVECYTKADVNGHIRVGGVVSNNFKGNLINCCSLGDITGGSSVGGVFGISSGGVIGGCYSKGKVKLIGNKKLKGQDVGGVGGRCTGTILYSCIPNENVSGDTNKGSLVGYMAGGDLIKCPDSDIPLIGIEKGVTHAETLYELR